jgi:hypothetical protein
LVLSATVLEKNVMNSPTEERWKKPKLDRSWAEASCTAGAVPFRRIAIEKSFILVMGVRGRSDNTKGII